MRIGTTPSFHRFLRVAGPGLWLLGALFLLSSGQARCDSNPTLKIWAMGAEGERLPLLIRRFQARYPEVRVIHQTLPWGEAHSKLITAYVGGHSPDIAQLGTTWMPEFHAMGALRKLDDLRGKHSPQKSDFIGESWRTVSFSDGQYGLPWYVETRCLFYRKDALSRAGWSSPPATWEELEALGRALKSEPGCLGIALPERDEQTFLPFLWQADGELLNSQREPQVLQAPFLRALRFYSGLFRQGIAPLGVAKDLNLIESFRQPRPAVPVFVSGPWMLSQIRRKAPEIEGLWGVAPLPRKERPASYLGGCNLVVFRQSRNPEAALRFLEIAAEPETQVEWYQAVGALPARRVSWLDPALQADPQLDAFRQQLDSARPPPMVAEWEQIADSLARTVEQVVRANVTDVQASKMLDRRIRKILAPKSDPQPLAAKVLPLCVAALLILVFLLRYLTSGEKEGKWHKSALLFLAPAVLLLLLFLFLPLVAAFLMSLTDYDLYSLSDLARTRVVWLENYRAILWDPLFWKSVWNTLLFSGAGGPLTIVTALAAALAVERMGKMRGFFLGGFFLPVVTTLVAVAVVWKWIYHPGYGLLNALLQKLGGGSQDWLADPRFALWCLVAMAVWKNFGYSMVILLAGLQAIPRMYYEAAALDGAGPLRRLWAITVPLLAPTLGLVTLMTTVGYLQFFAEPYVMTAGGPVDSTLSVVMYLYQKGFKFYQLGEAAAVSFLLFFLIFALSLGQILWARHKGAGA